MPRFSPNSLAMRTNPASNSFTSVVSTELSAAMRAVMSAHFLRGQHPVDARCRLGPNCERHPPLDQCRLRHLATAALRRVDRREVAIDGRRHRTAFRQGTLVGSAQRAGFGSPRRLLGDLLERFLCRLAGQLLGGGHSVPLCRKQCSIPKNTGPHLGYQKSLPPTATDDCEVLHRFLYRGPGKACHASRPAAAALGAGRDGLGIAELGVFRALPHRTIHDSRIRGAT